jgi:hypothetical protein
MTKVNKAVTKFSKLYGRNIEDMAFCPEDNMKKFSSRELLELKMGMKDKVNALNNPGMEQLFLKLKKLFIEQVLEGVDDAEHWVQEELDRKKASARWRKAVALKVKVQKEVESKLSAADRKLLGL